jgi:hypothetical protein
LGLERGNGELVHGADIRPREKIEIFFDEFVELHELHFFLLGDLENIVEEFLEFLHFLASYFAVDQQQQFKEIIEPNELEVGLCYLPLVEMIADEVLDASAEILGEFM